MDESASLRSENEHLRRELDDVRDLVRKMQSGTYWRLKSMISRYYNSDLIQETLRQKDTIASLNTELDRKNDRIRELESSISQKEVLL